MVNYVLKMMLTSRRAVVTSANLTSVARNATKIVNTLVIITNSILYAAFVVIVLVFHYEEPSSSEQCGRRFVFDERSHAQRAVSIIYAALIALFSLILAFGFIIFGNKLYQQFKSRRSVLNTTKSEHERRVMLGILVDI